MTMEMCPDEVCFPTVLSRTVGFWIQTQECVPLQGGSVPAYKVTDGLVIGTIPCPPLFPPQGKGLLLVGSALGAMLYYEH